MDNRNVPTQVEVETETHWKSVYAGKNSTAAITTDDELFMWGDNAYGQLGLGNSGGNTHRNTPTPMPINAFDSK